MDPSRVVTRVALAVLLLMSALAAGQSRQAKVSAVVNQSALRPGDKAVVAVVVDVPAGLHAQSHTPAGENYIGLSIAVPDTAALHFGEPVYPAGKDENYPGLGMLNVYEGRVVIYVPAEVKAGAAAGPAEIAGTITYQMCDDRTCFFPQRDKPWSAKSEIAAAGTAVTPVQPELFAGYKAGAGPATTQSAAASPAPATQAAAATAGGAGASAGAVAGGGMNAGPAAGGGGGAEFDQEGTHWSVLTAFGAAFLAGLLFNIMPCVLPVLPLKAVGFYEVSQHRRGQSVLFGLVFSLGLIAVFAVLALLVLVLRVVSWGGLFSQGWFVWTIVAILVLMAIGLLGAFTVTLPTAVYNVTPRHDTYLGNFLFGGLTAILATPCTAPLLPALLLWAASRSALIGVPAMVMVGVGMAFPYLILSAFPEVARRLPRAGAGAELFKQMMAFLLLIAAAYFAGGRLIEGPGFWWLVTAVVAVAGLYLLARTVQITKNAGPVAFSAILAVAMVGGAAWWSATVNGLGRSASGGTAAGANATWQPYSTTAFEAARKAGKPVLVKFTANWCASCQYIEGTVFADASVWDELHRKDVVTFKADFTHDNPEAEKLLLSLNPSGGIPLTAIYVPGRQAPRLLASVYTAQTLLDALKSTPAVAVAQSGR